MLKLFLTGDNHIGLKYASHEKAALLCEKRIEAFRDMVRVANDEDCALFVIAGDLFENTYGIAKRDISRLLDMLSCFRGTVIVLPGNHDYYDKESKLWQYFRDLLQGRDNIMLLTEYRPYGLTVGDAEVVVYPALCTSLHSAAGENNLDWIKNENIIPDAVFRVGIAHGAVEGETIDSEGAYFLMKRDELESIPLDLWLIGHTHVPFPRNLREDGYSAGERIFNAGTHVQTDVSCGTDGQCFIIEIDGDKNVRAKKVPSGNLRFYRKSISVSAGELEEKLSAALKGMGPDSVVDIILSGAVSAEEYDSRGEIIEKALSGFIEGTYIDYGLSRLISKELIDSEFPETSFSAALLTALLDEPKEAQLAYELLKSMKEGK